MMHVPQNSARIGTVFTATEMSYETNKTTPNGRVVPTVQKRPKIGPYVAPRLATSSAAASSPELSRDTRSPIRSPNGAKEDVSTPVKSFLSSNITPRSGARTARVNSPASTPGGTPTGTPSSSRPTSMLVNKDNANNNGLEDTVGSLGFTVAPQGPGVRGKSGSVISTGIGGPYPLRGISPERLNQSPQDAHLDTSPMFFHANDAKSGPLKSTSARPQSFVQANGKISTGSGIASPNEQAQSKFYHANGMPDKGSRSRPAAVSNASDTRPSPRLATNGQAPRRGQTRSISPLKRDQTAPVASARQRRSPSSSKDTRLRAPKSRSPSTSNATTITTTPRRASPRSQDIPSPGHKKTQSNSSVDSTPQRRRSSLVNSETVTAPLIASPLITSPSIATPSPTTEPDKTITSPPVTSPPPLSTDPSTILPPIETQNSHGSSTSPLTSPTRAMAPKHTLEEMNRLAANARRERKVLDLEISNSSLLAINRTLEREMRKQHAELRRYRRLTSAGRISLPRHSISRRISSLNSTATSDDGSSFNTPSLSGSDDEELTPLSDLDELSDEESDAESTHSDTSLSPEALAAREARQRNRDEKRLRLDLSKHKEALIESQRMNASLKRCLGWTEDLIAEGKKALAYEVRISDVEVGGRILTADEVGVELDTRQGLLSPGLNERVKGMDWGKPTSPRGDSPGGQEQSGATENQAAGNVNVDEGLETTYAAGNGPEPLDTRLDADDDEHGADA